MTNTFHCSMTSAFHCSMTNAFHNVIYSISIFIYTISIITHIISNSLSRIRMLLWHVYYFYPFLPVLG